MLLNKRIELFGCPIDCLTMQETIAKINDAIISKKQLHHVVVNAAKLVGMQTDNQLREAVVYSDIINADGQSIVWAANILGKSLPERVAGIDLMENIVKLAHEKKYKIYFLGAKEEVVQKVIDKYARTYSPNIIAGYRNGYFLKNEELVIANDISKSNADILLVAMTSPKKEIFLNNYKHIINTSFIMGVGGSFDVVADFTKRAPIWMQKNGLEWLFRIIQEPKRMWKRYLVTNTIFIKLLLGELFKNYTCSIPKK